VVRTVVLSSRVRLLAALCLLVLGASSCSGDRRTTVEVEPVTGGEVTQTVSAPAAVEAAAKQDVAAAVNGVVIAVNADDGGRVKRGQTVLRLASTQVDLAREQAAAAQAAAAGVGRVNIDGSGDATLAAAQRAVADLDRSTRPRLRQARRRAERIDDRQQRRAAVAAVDAVEASYQSTRAALLSAGRSLAATQDATADSLSRALAQAVESATSAQRLQAQAAAAAAAQQADNLVVKAPFRGVVQFGEAAASDGAPIPVDLPPELAGLAGSIGGLGGGEGGGTLRVGAPVVAGQTLFSVFDLSDIYVTADIDEVDAPQVRIGQRATVLVDAFADTPLEGVVERMAVAATPTTAGGVGYPVRIRLLGPADPADESPLGSLRVGMTSSAEVITRTEQSELVVPSRALLRRDGDDVVFVVRNGRAVQVAVDIAALGEDRAAVAGDLARGDEVVVRGYEDLEDGDEVVTP
jgi:multidrug efflux pump subunit AcrA (membrane-fusion protein)